MFTEKRPEKIKPFLRWAGGKRWFVVNYSELLPKNYKRYIEPFLGSGAVFFHLQPHESLLGDCNKDLINTYKAIKSEWELVYLFLKEHHSNHSKEHYYKTRSSCPTNQASSAARFIYLNRTCWNGLYRVNMSGMFNVPIGTRSTVVFDDDDFEQVSRILQNAMLFDCDFEKLVDMAEDDDLIFVDPPYTVLHNHNAFVRYNERLFSWTDQERLFKALKRARQRGAKIVGTNAYHLSVREFYEESFTTIVAYRSSSISAKIKTRSRFEELIFYTE